MARVTSSEVRSILPTSTTLTGPQLDAAIAAATCVVDQVAAGCGADLSDDCLKQVELYLSAHYAAATENTLTLISETDPCGGGKAVYGFKFGEGVKGTPFGQMANTLSGGCLAEFDKTPVNLLSIGSHGDDLL
jgi:hypothetical protein